MTTVQRWKMLNALGKRRAHFYSDISCWFKKVDSSTGSSLFNYYRTTQPELGYVKELGVVSFWIVPNDRTATAKPQCFRGRLLPLLCGIFCLGTLPPLKGRNGRAPWICALLPSKSEVEGSRMQPLTYTQEGLYTPTAVTSQTPRGFWSMMP